MARTRTTKPFLAVLSGKTAARPPIWLMRQAGRYLPEYRALRARAPAFMDFCLTPELAAEATLQPIRRFGFDAAILFSDILVIPYALGQRVEFREGEGPRLDALADGTALAKLDPARVGAALAPVFETVRRVKAELGPETALIGFAGAPWTVATYMIEGQSSRDFAKSKIWALSRPKDFKRLLNMLVDSTAEYLVRQVEAGAEALQLFDSWAGAVPAARFEDWCVEPMRRIVTKVRTKAGRVPIILFPRGVGAGYRAFARGRTGASALSIDSSVAPDWAARELQPKLAVQGNLDPSFLIAGGRAMNAEIDAILKALRRGPFIFNLGHGITPETPPEHVAALVRRVRRSGR